MSSSNTKAVHSRTAAKTHEGGPAGKPGSAEEQLRRTVSTCLLWEDSFYENGVSVADRIRDLVPKVPANVVASMAVEMRKTHGLRHVPLLMVREMARGTAEQRAIVGSTLFDVITRADEIAEFLSIYWSTNDGKKQIASQIKKGLGLALNKFSEHELAKWDRKDKPVRLRDAMFLSHAKPSQSSGKRWTKAERKEFLKHEAGLSLRDAGLTEQELVRAKVANDGLVQSGTWEDRLSAGEDKKEVFEDLMAKGRLGGLAYIRNLRKMSEVKVDQTLLEDYSDKVKLWGILPHQFVTAARVNPRYEGIIDRMMVRSLEEASGEEDKLVLPGLTVLLVDVSGSMDDVLSKGGRSYRRSGGEPVPEPTRMDAASSMAIFANEVCEKCRVFTFSERVTEVPARRGLALRDAIDKSQPHSGTYLQQALQVVDARVQYDRIIVITDEQSADGGHPLRNGVKGYLMNVANYEFGVTAAGGWVRVSGWSPHLLRYIAQVESMG